MHHSLVTLFIAAFGLITTSAEAAVISCPPVTLVTQNQQLILNSADTPTVYFLKNITAQGIWIDHPIQHHSASAGWSSYLQTGNWSTLLVNRKNFAISCAAIEPGKVKYLNCSKVLSVCSPKITPPSSSEQKGTYWVAEDLKWDVLLKKVEKRGFRFN